MSVEITQDVLVELHGEVLCVTINRERRRNAITTAVLREISVALDRARDDRSVRAVVPTGAGSKAFCSGADLDWKAKGPE